MEKFEIEWKGEIYDCEWHDEIDFENLKNVSGASGFIFDDNMRLCMIKLTTKENWSLPGGGVEPYDKNFEDTLRRETDEEADLDLKDIKRLGYFVGFPRGRPEEADIQLRFVARVDKIKPQTIDPAENEIPQRVFISPEKFDEYSQWGDDGDFQIRKAIEKLNSNK